MSCKNKADDNVFNEKAISTYSTKKEKEKVLLRISLVLNNVMFIISISPSNKLVWKGWGSQILERLIEKLYKE